MLYCFIALLLYCFIALLLVTLLFSVALGLNAESAPDDASNRIKQELLDTQNALTSVKIEALKERLVQGDRNLIVRLDAQDSLLSQQNNRISDINMFVTGFGAIAAVLGVVAAVMALVGFYNVKSRASADAQVAAREWFDKHQSQLDEQTQAFQSKIEEQLIDFQTHIDQSSEQFSEHMAKEQENAGHQVKEVIKKLQGDVTASKERHHSLLTEMEESILSDASKATQDKPENSYTFDDWNTKAFAADQKQDYQEALVYWRKALDLDDISDIQSARTIFNISRTLEDLNNPEASLASYDDLLHRYGESEQSMIREVCANALFNKGLLLGEKLNNSEAEIASYDELLNRYGGLEYSKIREHCAGALGNKIVVLGRLGKLSAAISCFEDLHTRYAQSEDLEIQQQCHSARVNLTELLVVKGQPESALNHINQLFKQIDKAEPDFGIMHFLLWIAAPEIPQQTVLNAIRELPADVEFDWNWHDIRPLINQLPEPRKTQANHYISFFEEHQNIERLESELESVMS